MIKTTIASLLAFACASASAQEQVHLAKVIHVSPIQTQQVSHELSAPICTYTPVPMYRRIPVVRDVQARDSSAPVVAALIGAVIANQALRGSDGRVAGTLIGASVGYAAADGYSQNRGVVEYQTEVHYEHRESCRTEYVPVYRNVITGYRVTFINRGIQTTVVMNSHPGEYVKIVTSYRVEQ